MARKVFVSYKYADSQVAGTGLTCRAYVDAIADKIDGVEIFKGEEDDNDLSQFKDDTIRTRLKEKIRDSSITVVLISKGMKVAGINERDQWIPWEIKYSLRRKAYGERRSNSNGVLAVIIPDEVGSYEYYFEHSGCTYCGTRIHKTNELFEILRNNMFNKKQPNIASCPSLSHPSTFHQGNDHSYIHQVEWEKFYNDPSGYLDIAEAIRESSENYELQKVVLKA